MDRCWQVKRVNDPAVLKGCLAVWYYPCPLTQHSALCLSVGLPDGVRERIQPLTSPLTAVSHKTTATWILSSSLYDTLLKNYLIIFIIFFGGHHFWRRPLWKALWSLGNKIFNLSQSPVDHFRVGFIYAYGSPVSFVFGVKFSFNEFLEQHHIIQLNIYADWVVNIASEAKCRPWFI